MGRGLGILVLGLSLLALAPGAMAQSCAPAQLTRMTIRNVTPGLAAADPRAQPQQIWRQGATLLRREGAPDPAQGGAALLVVIAEPDIWTINLANRTGRHGTDPGPVFEVKAPILPLSADLPPQLLALEFGCEAEFVTRYAPTASQTVQWGSVNASAHVFTLGEHSVAFLMDVRRSSPLMISYSRQGNLALVLRYDEFRSDLPDRPNLFIPPKNIRIEEAGPEPQP